MTEDVRTNLKQRAIVFLDSSEPRLMLVGAVLLAALELERIAFTLSNKPPGWK